MNFEQTGLILSNPHNGRVIASLTMQAIDSNAPAGVVTVQVSASLAVQGCSIDSAQEQMRALFAALVNPAAAQAHVNAQRSLFEQ